MKFQASNTVAGFMRSDAFARFIMGPVGSGKSTGCLMELIRRMSCQAPGPDGIRHTRFAVVRQTLQQIKQTVLKEFDTWIAPIATFKVSENTIYIAHRDIRSEIHLIPLDDEQDQRRLLSMQLSGVWVNEFPEVDPDLFPAIAGRVGRYPSAAQGGPTWFGIIADGNFPDEGGRWHELLELQAPPDWDVWKQPGGLSDEAENIENLPGKREYYERLERQHSPNWVRRYVHAQYGDDPSGTAVFRESFKASFHAVDELLVLPGHPILVGLDFGRDPCAILMQHDHKGRLLVLDEIIAEDIGLEQQINTGLRPRLQGSRYLGRPVAIVGDPAGRQRSTVYEETCFDVLKRAGFHAFPAPSNSIDARIRAVESFLLAQRDGGPAFLIDRGRCPTLLRAMNGGYRFARTRTGAMKPLPEKNKYSHAADALQYGALAAHGGMLPMIGMRILPRRKPAGARVGAAGWT